MQAGDSFGSYEIQRLIGRGGMGSVFLARDTRFDRQIALKILLPEFATESAFRERFIRESRIAAGIEHPHVVPVYDAGELDGQLFIAMRFIDGTNLRDVLVADGAMSVPRAVDIVEQLASALDSAHLRGLVHRDVKPANVLLAASPTKWTEDHCYLTDFGIARRSGTRSLTGTGVFVGTMDYAAPEQFSGEDVDQRTDVYALACLLFEMLSGRPPFQANSDAALMYAHLEKPPPSLLGDRSDVPAAFDPIVATGMAKLKDDRFASAHAFATACREAGQQPVTRATAVRPPEPSTAAPVSVATAIKPSAQEPGPSRKRLYSLIAALAVVLAVLLGFAIPKLSPTASRATATPAPTTTSPKTTATPASTAKPKLTARPTTQPQARDFAATYNPPWSGPPLRPNEVPSVFAQQWNQAENRSTCAAIAPQQLGAGSDGHARRATFSGGWAVAYDRPHGAGVDTGGYNCNDCGRSAFGVAGAGTSAEDSDIHGRGSWKEITWADGSGAAYGLEGDTGPGYLAYLKIAGQDCLYNVWSHIGEDYLLYLLNQLRYVAGAGT